MVGKMLLYHFSITSQLLLPNGFFGEKSLPESHCSWDHTTVFSFLYISFESCHFVLLLLQSLDVYAYQLVLFKSKMHPHV